MRQPYAPLLIFALTLASSCRSDQAEYRGSGRDLAEFPNTQFVATLEQPVAGDKNIIYCTTLLYAWDEVRDIIGGPLEVDSTNTDLYFLNKSTSHVNTLHEEEFSSGAEENDGFVIAWAALKKTLPFEYPLSSFKNELTFQNRIVASFGEFRHDLEKPEIIHVLYYRDNDNFLIKLSPSDKDHEIFLYMTDSPLQSLSGVLKDVESKKVIGAKEMKDENLQWKFFLTDEDHVIIPKISFNIQTHYPFLEKPFFTDRSRYEVLEAWQRMEFSLDESGAKVESEAAMAVDSTAGVTELPKPKRMRFEKPFFLMLKRTDSPAPYFCMWVANSELMFPQEE